MFGTGRHALSASSFPQKNELKNRPRQGDRRGWWWGLGMYYICTTYRVYGEVPECGCNRIDFVPKHFAVAICKWRVMVASLNFKACNKWTIIFCFCSAPAMSPFPSVFCVAADFSPPFRRLSQLNVERRLVAIPLCQWQWRCQLLLQLQSPLCCLLPNLPINLIGIYYLAIKYAKQLFKMCHTHTRTKRWVE